MAWVGLAGLIDIGDGGALAFGSGEGGFGMASQLYHVVYWAREQGGLAQSGETGEYLLRFTLQLWRSKSFNDGGEGRITTRS